MHRIKKFFKNSSGATAAEYVLIAIVVSFCVIVAINLMVGLQKDKAREHAQAKSVPTQSTIVTEGQQIDIPVDPDPFNTSPRVLPTDKSTSAKSQTPLKLSDK